MAFSGYTRALAYVRWVLGLVGLWTVGLTEAVSAKRFEINSCRVLAGQFGNDFAGNPAEGKSKMLVTKCQ